MSINQTYQREFSAKRAEVAAVLADNLFDFQIDAVTKNVISLVKRGVSVMGDTPGAGKTYIGAACAKYLGLNLFVIATKSGLANFVNVAHLIGVPLIGISNYEMLKNGKYYLPEVSGEWVGLSPKKLCPYINIITQEVRDTFTGKIKLNKQGVPKRKITEIKWDLPDNTLILIDEIHRAKSGQLSGGETLNNLLVTSIRPYVNTRRRIYVSLMSASIINSVDQLDTLCYMLGLIKDTGVLTFKAFMDKFPKGDALKTIAKLMYPHMGSNTEKSDINLHNHIGRVLRYPITVSAQDKATIEAENKLLLSGNTEGKKGFAKTMSAWQTIERTKAQYIVSALVSDYNAGKSVVVMATFNATIDYLSGQLSGQLTGIAHGVICGSTPDETRQGYIKAFQQNTLRCLLVNVKIGGTSISLHDTDGAYPRVTYLFPTMSSIDFYQALGRIDRTGTRSEVVQKIVTLSDTESLDEAIVASMLKGISDVYTVQGYVDVLQTE